MATRVTHPFHCHCTEKQLHQQESHQRLVSYRFVSNDSEIPLEQGNNHYFSPGYLQHSLHHGYPFPNDRYVQNVLMLLLWLGSPTAVLASWKMCGRSSVLGLTSALLSYFNFYFRNQYAFNNFAPLPALFDICYQEGD